jgi:Siphovirus ReqiPepy6 Gp37-like protein
VSSDYRVYLNSPIGVRLRQVPFVELEYTLSVNSIGALRIVVDSSLDLALVSRDSQIEVWRSVDGDEAYLDGGKRWMIRSVTQELLENGERVITLAAACPNDLLRRRIIAYNSETTYTDKTDSADDLIKAFARENLGSLVNSTDRDVSAYANIGQYLAIDSDVGQGPSLTVTAARDNLLSTCQKIAAASATAGTYLAFDIVWELGAFRLKTYIGQRGDDHRSPVSLSPVVLSPQFGNLSAAVLSDDYTDEATIAIAGGQGVAGDRSIATATDTVRATASPFGAIERFVQANTTGDATALADVADGALRCARPRRVVAGRIQETAGTRYGRDWGWGDRVTVQIDEVSADARIDAVTVSVKGGVETIDAAIRVDDV